MRKTVSVRDLETDITAQLASDTTKQRAEHLKKGVQ